MGWQPISEYRPEYGPVVAWLSWPASVVTTHPNGAWVAAYQVNAGGVRVWVTQHDCVPCETTGRRITHFMVPRQPKGGPHAP